MASEDHMQKLAADWFEAWNAHDLDRILSHYREDVVFTSPFVTALSGHADGRLLGKDALRGYFEIALERFPDLHFRRISVTVGVSSLVLNYISVEEKTASELLVLDGEGMVRESVAHYA
jgi:ketosteroid isomerase-like protein